MKLAFKRMPIVLRIVIVVLAIDSVVRIVRWAIDLFQGEPLRGGTLIGGLICLVGAVLLFRGLRLGLDWILGYCAALLVFLVVRSVRGGEFSAGPMVTAAVLAPLCAYLAWCRQRLPWHEPGSYGHWMSDPDYRAGVADWFAERDRQLAQDRQTPPDPEALVRSLIEAVDDAEMVRHRLQAQPEHFAPAIVRALDDPRFRRRSPYLGQLIRILPESRHAAALPQLVACLDHLDAGERRRLLRSLATTGATSLASLLVEELAGEGSREVAEGLSEALRAGRVDAGLRAALEPALRACAAREGAGHAANVTLAQLDSETGIRLVDAALGGDEAALQGLARLGDAGLPLPDTALTLWRQRRDAHDWFWCRRLMPFVGASDEDLLQVLEVARPDLGTEPDVTFADDRQKPRSCCAKALEQLLERRHERIGELLEQAVALQLGELSDAAAMLLMRMHGVSDDWMFEHDDPGPAQRYLRALSLADAYACNGGFSHAFDCLDEADLAALVPALDAIAPPPLRELWLAAIHAVDPAGLPHDRAERQQKLMARYDAVAAKLDELESRYYRCKWRLYVAVARYAIAHRSGLAP